MALRWTSQGLKAAWRHESIFRAATFIAAVLAPVGVLLADDGREAALLLGALLLWLATVLVRTAIGAVIARFGAQPHELTERANRMADAGVLVVATYVVMTWIVLLL